MKYTPTYFDFDTLKHHAEIGEVFLLVAGVYILIYSVAWIVSKFPAKR
jgi:hypothetical protein